MSNIDHSVTTEQVIPRFESRLFVDNPESRFAVGIIAVGNNVVPGFESEFDAYLRLRANVYADQTRMISPDLVHDGIETDPDDARSVHFGIFEQDDSGVARAVGAIRLIVKTEQDDRPLPIEDFFPEAFETGKARVWSNEASRYIARHENRGVQEILSNVALSNALVYIQDHNLGPTYGVVEPALERRFGQCGLPSLRIADPKYVPEYAADNLGLEIYTALFAENVEAQQPGFLDTIRQHQSQGRIMYFGRQIVRAAEARPASDVQPVRALVAA